MRLSVIIVSYNVYPFLDNCLQSVIQSLKGIEGEIIVVDNASVDRTPALIAEHYPQVVLLANHENVGFAKANNQGIGVSQGQYVLLLNPDTILAEDTLMTCVQFMDQHPDAGAVGVRMTDGSGRYLPESKRGLPTLRASFMKMTGVYKIFPTSSWVNSYYQGHIPENTIAKIEVLTGAFMFIRSSALQKAGLLDEDFFMYGEDIDLSYRILRSGYNIYYLPTTSIIHYKGESTRKSSLNYILTFYQAMLIFTKKHSAFKGQQIFIKLAIYLHGFLKIIRQSFTRALPALFDVSAMVLSLYLVSKIWAVYYFGESDYFPESFLYFNIPLYTGITLLCLHLLGAYDKPYPIRASWMGFAWSFIAILVIYSLLPAGLRNSRMVILLGCLMYMFYIIISRRYFHPWKSTLEENTRPEGRKTILVAGETESSRIRELINRSKDQIEIAGSVHPATLNSISHDYLGDIDQLPEIVRVHGVREIIFSAQDVPFSLFTKSMTRLGPDLRYMLAASTTMNIVGSINSESAGESYAIRLHFRIAHKTARRSKRVFDTLSSFMLLILSPLIILVARHKSNIYRNIFSVLSGKLTWVSYYPEDPAMNTLPPLKPGIFSPDPDNTFTRNEKQFSQINFVYARDYHWTHDLSILSTQWQNTGRYPRSI